MCQLGANGNPWAGYRMSPSLTPKPRGRKSVTTDWAHHVESSSGFITLVVTTLFCTAVAFMLHMRVDAWACINVFWTSESKYYRWESLWVEWRRVSHFSTNWWASLFYVLSSQNRHAVCMLLTSDSSRVVKRPNWTTAMWLCQCFNGCETWTLTGDIQRWINDLETRCNGMIPGITWIVYYKDNDDVRVTNADVRKKTTHSHANWPDQDLLT